MYTKYTSCTFHFRRFRETKKKRKISQKNPPPNLSILIITYPPRWEQI